MGTKVKLQHYVPRFYLDNFTIKPKKHSIYCYDKSSSKAFVVSTKNVASETYFYDKSNDVEQKIEEAFCQIESSFLPIYHKILDNADLRGLDVSERINIASFAIAQELRTREYRERLKDMGKQLKESLYKRISTYKNISTDHIVIEDEFHEKYDIDKWGTEEDSKLLHLSSFDDIPEFTGIIFQMKWIIFINHTPIPLWTSDHPINRYNSIHHKLRGNLGLLCKGIEIYFPLSPRILLGFTDPALNQLLPDKIEITDIQNIIFQNSLQVMNSTRYIFSNSNDFSLADTVLNKNSSLRNVDRKRVKVSP